MKKTALFSLAVFAILSITTLPSVNARGKMPLPPAFSGGNAGAWLGRGPLFGFDSLLIGPGFGSGGGGGGIGNGFFWDPEFGGTGGAGGLGDVDCPGNCLRSTYTGPCKYLCECQMKYRPDSTHTGGQGGRDGECINTQGQGTIDGSCKNEYTFCIQR